MFQHITPTHLDLRSFHAVGSSIAQSDSWAKLLQLFINVEELNMQTDAVLGNILCSSSRRNWKMSLLMSSLFVQRFIEPDSVTYCSLASAHGYLHRWRHALTFLEMEVPVSTADAAYLRGSCSDACAKRFAWEAASILIEPEKLETAETVFLAAIEGQSKASQWTRSVQQLEGLKWHGLQQNVLLYSALGSGQHLRYVTSEAER